MTPGPSIDPAALDDADRRTAANAVADGLVPLHAAAVEVAGRIVALAGPSGSGKSTLAAAAVFDGERFVADEITAVGAGDLAVRPYHRPIGIRSGAADALGLEFPAGRRGLPDAVHPVAIDDPQRLSHGGHLHAIALVHRAAGASAAVDRVEAAQALTELAQHIVVDDDQIPDAFRRLDRIVRAVPVVRISFDAPADGVRMLRQAVER